MNLAEFIAAHGITVDTEWKSRQLESDGNETDVWAVTLHKGDLSMDLPMRMGQGLQGRAPTAEDVLECILSDVASVENASGFYDWLSEVHGTDDELPMEQLKELEKAFAACNVQREDLSEFLGDAYETALWHLESE